MVSRDALRAATCTSRRSSATPTRGRAFLVDRPGTLTRLHAALAVVPAHPGPFLHQLGASSTTLTGARARADAVSSDPQLAGGVCASSSSMRCRPGLSRRCVIAWTRCCRRRLPDLVLEIAASRVLDAFTTTRSPARSSRARDEPVRSSSRKLQRGYKPLSLIATPALREASCATRPRTCAPRRRAANARTSPSTQLRRRRWAAARSRLSTACSVVPRRTSRGHTPRYLIGAAASRCSARPSNTTRPAHRRHHRTQPDRLHPRRPA